jgi:hypothetical protein
VDDHDHLAAVLLRQALDGSREVGLHRGIVQRLPPIPAEGSEEAPVRRGVAILPQDVIERLGLLGDPQDAADGLARHDVSPRIVGSAQEADDLVLFSLSVRSLRAGGKIV